MNVGNAIRRAGTSCTVVAALLFAGVVVGSSPSTAATPSPCTPSGLSVHVGKPQGTAGTSYYPLIFTNTGTSSCTIFGVPGVQPVSGANRTALGPAATSTSMGMMPALHTLAHNASVSSAIGVVDTGNYTASTCAAQTANGIIVHLGTFVLARFEPVSWSVCTKRSSVTTRLLAPGTNG